ncbi:NADH-quinone oxidoreductase subunit M [Propioniciclava coleopterorum]|uniref:NADH-quinone oxidoreductase subunit M n=1 Tax=Propioniciclava coleopterorum TaxID=2714937 RepID=A0A6G7Y456_9ACTN|nr:NADH-quinone oxidoreductase subunit M [Propioniciclava coleopterorum]QIK71489.1 NADH-quinone oxidoreductase subunit M [Propioniciclava coleopterorum]
MTFPWLTFLGLLPIIGGLVLLLPMGRGAARTLGLVFSLATLATGATVAALYAGGTDLSVAVPWIRAFGAWWALGLDGMGLAMVLLTVILTPVVLLAEWTPPAGRWSAQTFFALVLILEGLSLFVFTATDVLLFYLFFEATLVPVYFLIVGFGGERRGYAAMKFLLFSLAGGLIMLASVVGLFAVGAAQGAPSYLIGDLAALRIDGDLGRWLMLGFLIAFIVKAPMVPLHTWLPDAAAASTPGTATLLVGILDKIGTFGMVRFCLGLFPEASTWIAPFMMVFAIISILWGALAAVGSTNMMRLVSYTSVSHFGFMVLGIYAFTSQSQTGSIFYMLNHGFSTAALFLAVGFLAKRRGSYDINAFGGVQKVAPVAAGVLLVACLSALSLPGLSTFVSEFLVIAGTWARNPLVVVFALPGVVLAAVYSLAVLYQRPMTGPLTEQSETAFTGRDLNGVERFVMVPVIGALLFLGFVPQPAVQLVEPTAKATMEYVGVADPAPVVKGAK